MSVFYLEATKRYVANKRPNFTPLWILLVILISASFLFMNNQTDSHDSSAQVQHGEAVEMSNSNVDMEQSYAKRTKHKQADY